MGSSALRPKGRDSPRLVTEDTSVAFTNISVNRLYAVLVKLSLYVPQPELKRPTLKVPLSLAFLSLGDGSTSRSFVSVLPRLPSNNTGLRESVPRVYTHKKLFLCSL